MLKVALIDESMHMQQALRMLLSTVGGLEIVGTAVNAAGALELMDEVRPDVFVIDIDLREGELGVDLLRRLAGAVRPVDVVVMSERASAEGKASLLSAGARAVFDKAAEGRPLADWMRGRVAAVKPGPVSGRQPTDRYLYTAD